MSTERPALALLADLVPSDRILLDEQERATRTRDWWPLARLLEVRGDAIAPPDAVLRPQTTDEVSTMLGWATRTGTTIVPRGRGSGVCGGVLATAGTVVLELGAMDHIVSLDERSRTVVAEAGIRGDELEAALAEHDLTMGHLPQSLALSTPGGWVSAWSAGQATPAYGAIEDRLVGLTAVLADGTIVHLRPMPRWTAGIDLRRLFLGAEGALGVVTEVALALSPLEHETAWRAWRMADLAACLDAARSIRHGDIHPAFLRGWDEADAARAFGTALGHDGGAVLLVGIRAGAPGLEGRLAATSRIATDLGGAALDDAYGATWWSHRLGAVETFDRVMGPERSLGPGSVLDTFEVTGQWADLPAIHRDVTGALRSETVEVGCHFSHVYPTGAALYFTFTLRAPDDLEAESRYLALWDRALDACHRAGGSIAHHHGIGRLKGSHLAAELGPEALTLLRRVTSALDPQGTLVPGAPFGRRG